MKKFIKKIFNKSIQELKSKHTDERPSVFNNGKPLSDGQWKTIKKSISDYWKEQTGKKNEEKTNNNDNIQNVIIKKPDSQRKKKYYHCTTNQNKTEKTQNSDLDECLRILPELLDFSDLDDNLKTEIINEIRTAYKDNLSSVKLASNLYWKYHTITDGDRVVRGLKNKKIYGTAFKDDSGSLKIKLDEPLKSTNETIIELRGGYNKIVDSSLQLNWNFIASNALGYIHNNIKYLNMKNFQVIQKYILYIMLVLHVNGVTLILERLYVCYLVQ